MTMVLRWVQMYHSDLGIVALFVELFAAYSQCGGLLTSLSHTESYHVTSTEELAVITLLLDFFCIYADNTLATVSLQGSILTTLMNFFDGYSSPITPSASHVAVICQAFLQPSFCMTVASLLNHIFRVACCLHELDATASVATPLHDTRTLTLAHHTAGTLPTAPGLSQSFVFCINLTPKKKTSYHRRHCLSRSIYSHSPYTSQHAQQEQPASAVAWREDVPVQLSAEEMAFDWTTLVLHLLQFIQGVTNYDENISRVMGMESCVAEMELEPLKKPLLCFYTLYHYINTREEESFESQSIELMLKDILETNCSSMKNAALGIEVRVDEQLEGDLNESLNSISEEGDLSRRLSFRDIEKSVSISMSRNDSLSMVASDMQ